MSRTYARISASIWADEAFRALDIEAQGLYFRLLTDPDLSMCGVTDWRPARLMKSFGGMTKARLARIAEALERARFVVIDEETEEVLIRSFVRHDGVLKSPNLTKGMATGWVAIASPTIRDSVVREVLRYRETEPDAKGFAGLPDWFPKSIPNPSERVPEGFQNSSDSERVNPSERVQKEFQEGFEVETTEPFRNSSETVPLSNNQQPTTNNPSIEPRTSPTPKRAHALPDGWEPDPDVVAVIRSEIPSLDLRAEHAKFTDHFRANGKAMKDWNAAWRNWMRRARAFAPSATRQQRADDAINGAFARAASGAPNPFMESR